MKEIPKVPDECPFIKTCTRKMFKGQFRYICFTSAWVYCDFVKEKDLEKYKLTPKQWKEILE